MNKLGMVLGLAAVAAVAGCKDPNWNRWSSKNEAKNAGGATEVVAEAGCKCPPGTTHIGPCGCGAADCQCISLPETPKCTCAPGTVHELPCACGAPDCKCVVVKHDAKPVVATPVATTPAAPVEPEYTVYIVQRGDYLAKISKKYNITINSIKRLNNMKDDTIRIGQKIKLPGKVEVGEQKVPEGAIKDAPKAAKKAYAPYTGATKEYVVKSGDTLGAIAYGNGINIRQLKELNNLESDVLKVGHHGSLTSTSDWLVDRLRPSVAVVSYGIGNPYGLPSGNVLSMLSTTELYGTGANGTVVLSLDGSSVDARVEREGRPASGASSYREDRESPEIYPEDTSFFQHVIEGLRELLFRTD